MKNYNYPDKNGFYGEFGGAYVCKVIKNYLNELSEVYFYLKKSGFLKRVYFKIKYFFDRPSIIYKSLNFSEMLSNNIYFKREDLNFTNSHKINNTVGQIMIAKYMGKKEIIAETGAGQHGLSVATISIHFKIKCKIFMGYKDSKKQKTNLKKMLLLGADVVLVKKGNMDLNEAINQAIVYWKNNKQSYYLIGSVVGPHPYPVIVRDLQSIIGKECNKQIKNIKFLDYVMACVGGGSNSIGLFHNYITYKNKPKLIGIEACGNNKKNSVFKYGKKGIIHGCKTLILKRKNKIVNINSISSGLNYPSVGPEHCYFYKNKIVNYKIINNKEALKAFKKMSLYEGIIPSIESSHAIAYLFKISNIIKNKNILINLSGSGEKDI
ncbi:tryptophan synthase subunit beta [Candidatus Vidania fulgoroideorum]